MTDRECPVRPLATLLAALLLAASPCTRADDAQAARNIENVKLQHGEIWSKGNFALIPELFAENYVGHFPGGQTVTGRDAVQPAVEGLRAAFPDWTETIEQIVVDGDRVVTLYRSTGTQTGEFMGQPPSGKHVEILEACVFQMHDGLVVEQWAFPDILSLQMQLASE